MPRLTSPQKSALADWWPLALQAGFNGYTATDTVSAASDLASQFGRSFTFGEGSAISSLFGYARRMSNASDEVTSAADEDYIESRHIAIPPWARDEGPMNANPMWHVSYNFTYLDADNNVKTDYKTSIFEGRLPPTIGDLRAAVDEDAQALAAKYNVNYLNSDLHQILAI